MTRVQPWKVDFSSEKGCSSATNIVGSQSMLASRDILVIERPVDENAVASATSSFRWFDKLPSSRRPTEQISPNRWGLLSVADLSRVCSCRQKKSFHFDNFLFSDWMRPRREMHALIWRKEEAQLKREEPWRSRLEKE